MARHKDDDCLIAHGHGVERRSRVGIARIDQPSDHRWTLGVPAIALGRDDLVDDAVDTLGRTVDLDTAQARHPVRQTEE